MNSKQMPQEQGEFSKMLCKYISESGYSVYKLSQITGLGRSAIQHTMSGKLMPAKDFVRSLINSLPVTPFQREELRDLYYKDKLGEKAYHTRKMIIDLIEELPHYYFSKNDFIYYPLPVPEKDTSFSKAVTGTIEVNNYLKYMLLHAADNYDKPFIFTTIPFENENFFEMMMSMLSSIPKNIAFTHCLRLFKNGGTDGITNNMNTLKNALKMSVNPRVSYNPYYHYAYKESAEDFLPAFPYMFIVNNCAALISSDFKCAYISSDPELMNVLKAKAKSITDNSSLMMRVADEHQMFNIFMESCVMYSSSIEFQPCLTGYLTMDIIKNRIINSPIKDMILRNVETTFFKNDFSQMDKALMHPYFTPEGLREFAETGKMANIAGLLLEPLSLEERLDILTRMKADSKYYLMLDQTKISFPKFMQIIMLTNKNIIISCITAEKNFCCTLSEAGLCSAFESFLGSLEDTGLTLDRSETEKAIDECINLITERITDNG